MTKQAPFTADQHETLVNLDMEFQKLEKGAMTDREFDIYCSGFGRATEATQSFYQNKNNSK